MPSTTPVPTSTTVNPFQESSGGLSSDAWLVVIYVVIAIVCLAAYFSIVWVRNQRNATLFNDNLTKEFELTDEFDGSDDMVYGRHRERINTREFQIDDDDDNADEDNTEDTFEEDVLRFIDKVNATTEYTEKEEGTPEPITLTIDGIDAADFVRLKQHVLLEFKKRAAAKWDIPTVGMLDGKLFVSVTPAETSM